MLTFKPSLYSEFHCIDYKISWENTGAFSQMYLKYFCSNSWLTDTFINITFWLVDDLALPTATQVKRVNDTLVTQSLSLIKAVNLVEANPPLTYYSTIQRKSSLVTRRSRHITNSQPLRQANKTKVERSMLTEFLALRFREELVFSLNYTEVKETKQTAFSLVHVRNWYMQCIDNWKESAHRAIRGLQL